MVSPKDVSAIVTHRRYRDLGEAAQALYLELYQWAAPSGRVDLDRVRGAVRARAFGAAAFDELLVASLLTVEPDDPGIWVVEPRSLDQAEAFATGAP